MLREGSVPAENRDASEEQENIKTLRRTIKKQ
jgi:hypothetical protein